jgi:hypothetical protein
MQKLNFSGKFLVALSAILAVGVSLFIFFSPLTIHNVTATSVTGGSERVETTTLTQSWYQVQGLWGVIVLVLFAGLYIGAFYLARQSAYRTLAILSLVALILSYLAGFSIGLFYLPSALALLVGTGLLWLSRSMSLRSGSHSE